MDLKIIEPIKKYLKEFNSPDEFNIWYSKHKDEMDALTTHKLNKLYHIIGYRITKIKGVLMLKKWDNNSKNDLHSKTLSKESDTILMQIEELEKRTHSLESEIIKIKESVNAIISFINSQQAMDIQHDEV